MTIRLVSHETRDSISLDKPSPLANPKPRFAERDRDWNAKLYERWFWEQLRLNESPQLKELDNLVEQWFLKGQLLLACDAPHLTSHADTVAEYLRWCIERRGHKVTIVKPGVAPAAPPRKLERQENIRFARTRSLA